MAVVNPDTALKTCITVRYEIWSDTFGELQFPRRREVQVSSRSGVAECGASSSVLQPSGERLLRILILCSVSAVPGPLNRCPSPAETCCLCFVFLHSHESNQWLLLGKGWLCLPHTAKGAAPFPSLSYPFAHHLSLKSCSSLHS